MRRSAVRAGATAGIAALLAMLAAPAPAVWSAAAVQPCPALCPQGDGPLLIGLSRPRPGALRVLVLVSTIRTGPLELVLSRSLGGRLAHADPTLINRHPREVLIGSAPMGGRGARVAVIRMRSMRSGLHARVVGLAALGRPPAAGVYVARVDAVSSAGMLRTRGSAIVIRITRSGRLENLLGPHRVPAPAAATGGASSIVQTGAVVRGEVNPNGRATRYYFQYGTTSAYDARTPSLRVGSGTRPVDVSAALTGLSPATTYHYRLVASYCEGCEWGTGYGADHTLTTLLSAQQTDADRAIATYEAMQQYFYAANVYPGDTSSLYVGSYPQSGRRYSFLWPFSRALVGTITLSGIPAALLGGASYQADVTDRLTGLSRYWDDTVTGPGYDSYPPAPYGTGGDKYYDDQAWVGLATAQNYQLTGDPTSLQDAENVFNFVYLDGSGQGEAFEPGGIYWVQQGVGAGVTNHDRTTNSTAPNAELALLLATSDPANAATYQFAAGAMYEWVNHYLYNVRGNATDPYGPDPNFDPTQPALLFDKVRGTNTIDEHLWTYNQGTMIAANVREYQSTGQSAYLTDAEAIANAALDTFSESDYIESQPAAFNAIFFRGLLVLYSVSSDAALKARIIQTIQTYADDAWNNYRGAAGLFRFPSSSGSGYQLLDQGAMLQIYAALAWNPSDYGKLP